MSILKFNFDENEDETRIDKFLKKKLEAHNVSRNFIQSLIEQSNILVNENSVTKSKTLKSGDEIYVNLKQQNDSDILAEKIALNIIYEDEHLIIVNKSSGMVTHPASGNYSGTLVNALLYHCKNLSDIGGYERLGIVHRLDKDTSGCIIAAKSNFVHNHLSNQFATRLIKKNYLALVNGKPTNKGGIIKSYLGRNKTNRLKITNYETDKNDLLNNFSSKKPNDNSKVKGKFSETKWELEKYDENKDISLIKCEPKTGRTHQLRVHLKENLHSPILGDVIYETRESARKSLDIGIKRLMLHAYSIGFTHPKSGENLTFSCEFKELSDFI